jgi:hypothetical protein
VFLTTVSCASFLVEPLWLLVYSTSPVLLGNGEEEPRLSCAKLCGRFCDCPLAGKGDCSRLSQGIEAPRSVSTKVRADATPLTRGLGRRLTVPGASGFRDRYPARVVQSSSFEFGGHIGHGATVDEESTTKQEADQERLPGELYWEGIETVPGGARHSVSSPALYDCVPAREAAGTLSGSLGKRYRASPTARLSHPALKDRRFWGELP